MYFRVFFSARNSLTIGHRMTFRGPTCHLRMPKWCRTFNSLATSKWDVNINFPKSFDDWYIWVLPATMPSVECYITSLMVKCQHCPREWLYFYQKQGTTLILIGLGVFFLVSPNGYEWSRGICKACPYQGLFSVLHICDIRPGWVK